MNFFLAFLLLLLQIACGEFSDAGLIFSFMLISAALKD